MLPRSESSPLESKIDIEDVIHNLKTKLDEERVAYLTAIPNPVELFMDQKFACFIATTDNFEFFLNRVKEEVSKNNEWKAEDRHQKFSVVLRFKDGPRKEDWLWSYLVFRFPRTGQALEDLFFLFGEAQIIREILDQQSNPYLVSKLVLNQDVPILLRIIKLCQKDDLEKFLHPLSNAFYHLLRLQNREITEHIITTVSPLFLGKLLLSDSRDDSFSWFNYYQYEVFLLTQDFDLCHKIIDSYPPVYPENKDGIREIDKERKEKVFLPLKAYRDPLMDPAQFALVYPRKLFTAICKYLKPFENCRDIGFWLNFIDRLLVFNLKAQNPGAYAKLIFLKIEILHFLNPLDKTITNLFAEIDNFSLFDAEELEWLGSRLIERGWLDKDKMDIRMQTLGQIFLYAAGMAGCNGSVRRLNSLLNKEDYQKHGLQNPQDIYVSADILLALIYQVVWENVSRSLQHFLQKIIPLSPAVKELVKCFNLLQQDLVPQKGKLEPYQLNYLPQVIQRAECIISNFTGNEDLLYRTMVQVILYYLNQLLEFNQLPEAAFFTFLNEEGKKKYLVSLNPHRLTTFLSSKFSIVMQEYSEVLLELLNTLTSGVIHQKASVKEMDKLKENEEKEEKIPQSLDQDPVQKSPFQRQHVLYAFIERQLKKESIRSAILQTGNYKLIDPLVTFFPFCFLQDELPKVYPVIETLRQPNEKLLSVMQEYLFAGSVVCRDEWLALVMSALANRKFTPPQSQLICQFLANTFSRSDLERKDYWDKLSVGVRRDFQEAITVAENSFKAKMLRG